MLRLFNILFCTFFLFSLGFSQKQEAFSLDGKALYQILDPTPVKQKKDSLLQIAQTNYQKEPNQLDNIIWLGRRLAYLTRYNEAIQTFTQAIEQFPEAPEAYRHRGHRYITTRELQKAIDDLEKAAALAAKRDIEVEPDGIPNKLNIPLSNLHFNIYYHLGLAYYLKGDFQRAASNYEICANYSINPDLLIATVDWLYMTYQRLGEKEKAEQILTVIQKDMEIIENDSYYKRLLMYKGILQAEELLDLSNDDIDAQLDIVTQGYGVANWYFYNGQIEKAKFIFERILATNYWPAFGYIAAEADYKRLKGK